MAHEEMRLALFTSASRVDGRMQTSGYRLLDILNNRMHAYLELLDATLGSARGAEDEILPIAAVAKDAVVAASVVSERHEAESRRAFSIVEKERYPAVVVAGLLEIRGTLHLEGVPEPVLALSGELDEFFPLTDASIWHLGTGEVVEVPVAMPNKAHISVFHIGERLKDRHVA